MVSLSEIFKTIAVFLRKLVICIPAVESVAKETEKVEENLKIGA
jgi:hypothetical protein